MGSIPWGDLRTIGCKTLSCGGMFWTKFETISSKIQMIKNTNADEAGRNNLSGGMDSPCLG